MIFYRFNTFVTSYYFPKVNKDKYYLYGLYSPYKNKLSRIYWWAFKKYSIIRYVNSIKTENLNFPYDLVCQLVGNNSIMSFNLGSPGIEQKISILGYDEKTKLPFFSKFAQKPDAMKLSINEINVLEILKETGLTPILFDKSITNNYVFMKTEYIRGMRPTSTDLTTGMLEFLLKLSSLNLTSIRKTKDGLIFGLSHGDFCPWNMLVNGNNLSLIDWEMTKDRPLGYDLFTFIFQTSFLLLTKISVKSILDSNSDVIRQYFKHLRIYESMPYLKYFSKYKMEEEILKRNQILSSKYTELYNYINK